MNAIKLNFAQWLDYPRNGELLEVMRPLKWPKPLDYVEAETKYESWTNEKLEECGILYHVLYPEQYKNVKRTKKQAKFLKEYGADKDAYYKMRALYGGEIQRFYYDGLVKMGVIIPPMTYREQMNGVVKNLKP